MELWTVSERFANMEDTFVLMLGHTQEVNCLLYDREVVISGSADRTVIVFERSGNLRHKLSGHRIQYFFRAHICS